MSLYKEILVFFRGESIFSKRASDGNNAPYFPIKRGPGSSSYIVRFAQRQQRRRVKSMGKSHSSKELQDMAKSIFVDPKSHPEPIYKNIAEKSYHCFFNACGYSSSIHISMGVG